MDKKLSIKIVILLLLMPFAVKNHRLHVVQLFPFPKTCHVQAQLLR